MDDSETDRLFRENNIQDVKELTLDLVTPS